MALFLDKIDAAPIARNEFPYEFNQWIAVLVDTLNEVIQDIEDNFNILYAPSYTAVQIAGLTLQNGVILYDTTNNQYVGKKAGALVKFTTTPYP